MINKSALAESVADNVTRTIKEKVIDAYYIGWRDAEENMVEKAEAMMKVAAEGSEKE